jgi:hypothetical protein
MHLSAYNSLLQYYEARLSEAKKGREKLISEAVDKAVNDKLREMHLNLENLIVEKKKVAEVSILSHIIVERQLSTSNI